VRVTVESVAFLSDYYHPFEVGGAERSTAALGRALADAGVRVLVLTPNYGAEPTARQNGVDIIRLPFPQRLEPGQLARRVWLANPLLQFAYAVSIARIVRRMGISVLHVQNSPLVPAGSAASFLSGRPMIVTIRDLAYLPPTSRTSHDPRGGVRALKWAIDRRYAKVERRLKVMALQRARRIVFVSSGLRALYEKDAPSWIAARSSVVYNIGPSPAESLPRDRCAAMILFVGKLSTGKGIDVLYDAIPEIVRQAPTAVIEIVGQPGVGWRPPPAPIQERVRFHGRLPEGAVNDLMRRAAVLVSPSIWPEPLSRVLLEAMSKGLPIVTTAVGGSREAVDDKAAEIVPAGDPTALANAVVRLLSDRDYAATLAQNALHRYQTLFTQKQIVPQMLDVYRTAV
jgi:glycosyltransferase involved in cell wall biosynthesis